MGFGVAVLVAACFGTVAVSGQQFFGDMRNLDDTHTKSHFAPMAYRSLEEWTARRPQLRQQILVAAGLVPFPDRTQLNARRISRKWHGTYFIEKVVIEPRPGFYLAGNLYVPANASANAKAPGVLVPHGHWKQGRAHQVESYSVPALCENLADQGYVAFAYDMIGYADTRQLPHNFGDSTQEFEWAYGPLGQQLWDSIRALDFLESLPEVDADHLGVTGASGGGTQTFLLSAVDERVKAAAPVDMVSAIFQGDDACELAAGLRVGTNNMEFAAMMAPRPLLLVSSTHDWTRHTPVEEFPSIKAVYALYGRVDLLSFALVDAEHNYNRASREAVYNFFALHLKPNDGMEKQIQESVFDVLPSDELLFGDKPEYMMGAPTQEQLFIAWKDAAERQTESLSRIELRDRLRETIGVEWPSNVEMLTGPGRMLLSRGHGERVPSQWIPGVADVATVVVNPDGSEAARKSQFVTDLQTAGAPALLLDVYQTGAAVAPVTMQFNDRLVFHRSDDADRIQDILTGLRWLHERSPILRLHCTGRASTWCLLAAAVAPFPVALEIESIRNPVTDGDLRKLINIPGLQRAGGLKTARLLVEPTIQPGPVVSDNLGTHN
jgi:Dienelactone hydrolase family